jgi:hypothetical protein
MSALCLTAICLATKMIALNHFFIHNVLHNDGATIRPRVRWRGLFLGLILRGTHDRGAWLWKTIRFEMAYRTSNISL